MILSNAVPSNDGKEWEKLAGKMKCKNHRLGGFSLDDWSALR